MEAMMRKRILVIDDDSAICDILKDALTDANFEVKVQTSAANIFDVIKDFRPNLLIIDYILPDINGGEICHQIKSNQVTKHIPIIMYTAYPRVLHSLGNYGWDLFIEKPFDLWSLIEKINQTIYNTDGYIDEIIMSPAYKPK